MEQILLGVQSLFQWQVILFCIVGCLLGTVVGILPGFGPLAAISLLLPATMSLEPVVSLVLLGAVYYGAMYGGSSTSILMRIPGETASVVTCLDGYAMTQKGRAGAALCIAAIGSFIAGTVSVIALTLLAPALAEAALHFGPPEMTMLLILGMSLLIVMGSGSTLKILAMTLAGLTLGMVGIDTMTGYSRFTFGIPELGDGFGIIPVAVGLFGVSEILLSARNAANVTVVSPKLSQMMLTREETRRSVGPVARGTVLGFLIGIMPGAGHIISSFASYALEKRISRRRDEFGHGAIEGVAGPESANNAAATSSLVPMLSLGLPSSPVAAVMLAAIMLHGVTPGPSLISQHGDIFWGFIGSMYLGNIALLILNLPLVGVFIQLLRIPYRWLYPFLLTFCVISVYSVNTSVFDVYVMAFMGLAGYVLRRYEFDPAAIVLAMVLAPMLELAVRQSLTMSGGDYAVFVSRPISLLMLACLVILVMLALRPLLSQTANWRDKVGLDLQD